LNNALVVVRRNLRQMPESGGENQVFVPSLPYPKRLSFRHPDLLSFVILNEAKRS
jgi:hypothetical protein